MARLSWPGVLLNTKTVYPRKAAHLKTNPAQRRLCNFVDAPNITIKPNGHYRNIVRQVNIVLHVWLCADTMQAFQHGLCSCFSNCSVCIITFFCPCYTAGKVAETTGRSCCVHSLLYIFCPCISLFCQCCVRTDIRQSKNIGGSSISDFFCHLCCQPCALCQESRETGALGSTDMAGAPGSQEMVRAWDDRARRNRRRQWPRRRNGSLRVLLHCPSCNVVLEYFTILSVDA